MRGYTLVEVLAVIILLTLIVLIAYPSLINTLQKNEQQRYEEFINTIKLAAEVYIEENNHIYNLQEPEDEVIITINDLVLAGLYSEATINPQTKEKVDLSEEIQVQVLENYVKEYNYPFEEE